MEKLIENMLFEGRQQYVHGGKGDNLSPSDVDPKQFAVGKLVEFEHTTDPHISQKIALDHLAEKKNYYTILVKAGLVDEPKALKMYDKLFGTNYYEKFGKKDKDDKSKAKKINEGVGYYNEDFDSTDLINRDSYWDEVASYMGAELLSFNLNVDEEYRDIVFSFPDGREVEVHQSWRHDGTPNKPVTNITITNDDTGYPEDAYSNIKLGRYPIFRDPEEDAEGLFEIIESEEEN